MKNNNLYRILRVNGRTGMALLLLGGLSCQDPAPKPGRKQSPADTVGLQVRTPARPAAGPTGATAPQPDAHWLLVPGEKAGLTRLNEDAAAAYQRFGRPDGGDAAMQKSIAVWYSHHDRNGHSTAIYTERDAGNDPVARIRQIRVTSPSFQTADGLHTGSTLREIEARYAVQRTESYTAAGNSYRVYDSKEGIAFEIDADGMCVAIIIHAAGVIHQGTYLKFRTTG